MPKLIFKNKTKNKGNTETCLKEAVCHSFFFLDYNTRTVSEFYQNTAHFLYYIHKNQFLCK